jgi:hypothetical protein
MTNGLPPGGGGGLAQACTALHGLAPVCGFGQAGTDFLATTWNHVERGKRSKQMNADLYTSPGGRVWMLD